MKYGETEITMDEQAIHVSAPRIEVEIGEDAKIRKGMGFKHGFARHLPAILAVLAIVLSLVSLSMRWWM